MAELKLDPKLTYDQALEQLQEIVHLLERKEITIDQLSDKVKTAKLLVDFCREKLDSTEEEINKIINPKGEDQDGPF